MNEIIKKPFEHEIVFSVTEEGLQALEKHWETIPDCTDKEGYETVRTGIRGIVSLRTSVEERRKELKSDAIEYGKRVDTVSGLIKCRLVAIEERLKEAKTIEDNRRKEEKEKKQRIEQERISRIKNMISTIADYAKIPFDATLEEIRDRLISAMDAMVTKDDFEEFFAEAHQTREAAVNSLQVSLEVMEKRLEAEAAREAELSRVRLEQEAEAQRLREEAERQEEARRAAEEELRKQREELKRQMAVMEAEQKERERIAEEKLKKQRDKEESERREKQEAIDAENARIEAQRKEIEKEKEAIRKAEEERQNKQIEYEAAEEKRRKEEEDRKKDEKQRNANRETLLHTLNDMDAKGRFSVREVFEAITDDMLPFVKYIG